MASILNEYISKHLGILELQNELQRLIASYNKLSGRFLFIYSVDINKGKNRGINVSLVQEDFYNIQDILICDNCNFALDLKPIKSQVETQTKRKVTFK